MSEGRDRLLLHQALRIIVVQGVALVGLGLLAVYLGRRPPVPIEQALLDPELRQAALRQLLDPSQGINDTFPDADVGRVLIPGLEKATSDGRHIRTNRYGVRERDFVLPKPAGTTRVVLLGDSFVFGLGIDEGDRACTFLEASLRHHATHPGAGIECLQIGVSSWNARSEVAYLRRQLSLLQPDVVVHLLLQNDLGDTSAARGFGTSATYTDQHRGRADSIVTGDHGRHIGFPDVPYRPLLWGLDHESRSRYDEVVHDLSRLASSLRQRNTRYLLLLKWSELAGAVRDLIVARLPDVETAYLPHRFSNAPKHTLSKENLHWNRAGNEAVAQFLFGWLEAEQILPRLGLRAWPEAERAYRDLRREGEGEALRALSGQELARKARLLSRIVATHLDQKQVSQIYCGVGRDGLASPYVSLVLARDGGRHLFVAGRGLGRPEIDGARVRVFVDEAEVGLVRIPSESAFELRQDLPSALLQRDYLSVRLVAEDYVYVGPELRSCAAFRLERVAVLP